MNNFMKSHFPQAPFALGHEFKGAKKDGNLKDFSYVEFINRDVADATLDVIKKQGHRCTNQKGDSLKIDKAKTAVQRQRWYRMRAAKELIEKDPKARGTTVDIETKMPVRKVVVISGGKSVTAFKQDKDDLWGEFVGDFGHLCFEQ